MAAWAGAVMVVAGGKKLAAAVVAAAVVAGVKGLRAWAEAVVWKWCPGLLVMMGQLDCYHVHMNLSEAYRRGHFSQLSLMAYQPQ